MDVNKTAVMEYIGESDRASSALERALQREFDTINNGSGASSGDIVRIIKEIIDARIGMYMCRAGISTLD